MTPARSPAIRRRILLLCAAFLAGIAIGPTADLIARRISISTAFAQGTDKTETYKLLRLFRDAFELVRREYVDPVSDRQLVENAIDGMLAGLDPRSAYLTPGEFRELEAEDRGQFVGIGLDC